MVDWAFAHGDRTVRIRSCAALLLVGALLALPGAEALRRPVVVLHENRGLVRDQIGDDHLSLTPATEAPDAALPAVAGTALRPHEVFGFAPYWTLPIASRFDVSKLSTIAYFGVDVNADGSLVREGAGWQGFRSQELANLESAMHQGGGRVVLTAKTFDRATLHSLSTNASAQNRLGDELVGAITDSRLDGANLDLEGQGSADRSGLATLVNTVANRLHHTNPHWQVSVDTYASSAADHAGWFDVASMAPSVDAFFVMTYDMYRDGYASPNAPLRGSGVSDEAAVAQYEAVLPAGKVILGAPFYGYDWVTQDDSPHSPARSAPSPLSYAKIAAAGHPSYWDGAAQVPWSSYRDGSAWHESYYDDPTSLALKAQLADRAHILGVGIWALGMEGDHPAMLAALTGAFAPDRSEISHPLAPNQTAAAGAPGPSSNPSPGGPGGGAQPPGNGGLPTPSPGPTPTPSPSPSSSPSPSPTPTPILPSPSP
jgi:hypothetical protein